MSFRGYFCAFPDLTSYKILREKYPQIGDDMHITILVIEDEKEIELLYDEHMNMDDFNCKIMSFGQLVKQNGESVDVLFVEESPCLHMKKFLIDKYKLKSDVYGTKQRFHITLGPSSKKDSKNNIEKNNIEIFTLHFNKFTFSIQSKKQQEAKNVENNNEIAKSNNSDDETAINDETAKSDDETAKNNTSSSDDETADINVRQAHYLTRLEKHIDDVIPIEKQHKWCLVFGQQLVVDFDTESEALRYKDKSFLHLVLVAPTIPSVTKRSCLHSIDKENGQMDKRYKK